ncbi:MAG TPA: hypothetical protein VED59_09715, partial [Acidimicrobiales bacterium]|nr:hypothetical protein [Acidimicrobiales bacterium]
MVLVAAVAGWNCWSLRATTDAAAYLDDSSVHEQMVRYATHAIGSGRLPLRGWFGYLSLGSPQFLHYQSLGAMLTGLAGTLIGPDAAFRWSLYLMVSLWPLAVYSSARLFGIERGASAAAAVLSPFLWSVPAIGYERSAYLWIGYGVWAQLWASWALPFAWASTWRAMRDPRYIWLAGGLAGVTTALHFETGYLAFLGEIIMALAAAGPLRQRLTRAAAVMGASIASAAWVVVPLVATSRWSAVNTVIAGTPLARGYGAGQDLTWLFTGRILDAGRFPLITLGAGAGVAAAVGRWRASPLQRALVALFISSLLLSFGPTTWGSLVNAVPGHTDLFFRRFMMGSQLAGLYLAGTGATAAGRLAGPWLGRAWRWLTLSEGPPAGARWFSLGVLSFTGSLLLWPAASQAASYDSSNALAISAQREGEARQVPVITPLVAYIRRHGGGRTYAGSPSNWGARFYVGAVPVFKYLESQDIDEVGYTLRTASLMSIPEYHFDDADASDYALFGVHYLLLPARMVSPVPAERVMVRGAYALWAIPANGYLDLVEVTGRLSANRSDVGSRAMRVLRGQLISHHEDWAVTWPGQPAALPVSRPLAEEGGPGTISHIEADLSAGALKATVKMSVPGTVLLSVTYDPGWHAWVDGHRAPTAMLAPAVVGIEVGRGVHQVSFAYE